MTLAQQRRYEVLASNLIYWGTLVNTVVNFFIKKGFWDTQGSRRALIILLIITIFILWVAYLIRKGRRWAKIVYVVIAIVGILPLIIDYHRFASISFTSRAATVSYFVQEILYVSIGVILVLSLRKPTPEVAPVMNK